jgi:hypothetical protein
MGVLLKNSSLNDQKNCAASRIFLRHGGYSPAGSSPRVVWRARTRPAPTEQRPLPMLLPWQMPEEVRNAGRKTWACLTLRRRRPDAA